MLGRAAVEIHRDSSLCGDDYCVPAGHTRSELGTHGNDQLLDVVTIFAGVVGHGDDLHTSNEFLLHIRESGDVHAGKILR